MTDDPSARRARIALCVLATVVVAGCVAFGAPPRFGVAHGAAPLWARCLETLAASTLIELAVACGAVLLLVEPLRHARAPTRRTPWLPLAALLALAVVGLVPLPRGLLHVAAPYSADTWDAVGAGGWRPRSLWPDGTWTAVATLLGMTVASAATWTAVRHDVATGRPGRTLRAVVALVAVVAALECAYGVYETKFAGDGYLGLSKLSGRGRVTGTFVHGTLLAVWAGMGACAATGLAAQAAVSRRWITALPWGAVALLTATGAALSLSRLGLVATACGVVVTAFVAGGALRRGGAPRVGLAFRALAVAAPVLGVAAVLAIPRLRERIGYVTDWLSGIDVPEEPRLAMWSSTLDLAAEAPVLGTGVGSFGRAIHLVQRDDVPQELWFAHSDLLNLLSDAGLVGLLLGLAWVGLSLHRARTRALPDTVDAGTRALSAAALGASVVVLVAALGDFQTQFPVVALPLAVLLTAPAALAGAARTDADDPPRRPSWIWRGAAAVGVVLALTLSARSVTQFAARWAHRDAGLPPAATSAERHLAAGRALVERRDRTLLPDALEQFTAAADLDPLLDAAHLWRGVVLLRTGERDAALDAIGRARVVSRGHTDVNLLAGQVYLSVLGTAPAPEGPAGDDALAALREAAALSPQAFPVALAAAERAGLDDDALIRLVPDRAHAWLTWAERAAQRGDVSGAIDACERAVRSEPRHVVARLRLIAALLAAGRADEAAPHATHALGLARDDAGLVDAVAAVYRAAGALDAGRAVFASAGAAWPGD